MGKSHIQLLDNKSKKLLKSSSMKLYNQLNNIVINTVKLYKKSKLTKKQCLIILDMVERQIKNSVVSNAVVNDTVIKKLKSEIKSARKIIMRGEKI